MFESAMISCELSSDELTSLGMGLARAFEEEAAMEWTGQGKTEGEASHRRIPQTDSNSRLDPKRKESGRHRDLRVHNC